MSLSKSNDHNNDPVVLNDAIVNQSLELYGQVNKRTWRMPWQLEAMKDVVTCEKCGGVGKQALIPQCPNGETHLFKQVS